MGWLKEISLVLIIASVEVLAGAEKASKEVPRIISEQDFRLLLNPFHFLYIKTTTTPKPPRPTTVRPPYPYPHYHQYPHYPPYPHYPHYPNFLPYPPPPTEPTSTTEPPTKPSKPTERPSKIPPHKLPQAPKYPPPPPFYTPPFSYHPWYLPPPPLNGASYIVFISPPGPGNESGNSNNKDKANEGDGNKGNGNKGDGNKGDGNKGDGNKGDGNKGDGNKGDGNKGDGNKGDGDGNNNKGTGNKEKRVGHRKDSRFIPPNPYYPYIENAKIVETFHIPEVIANDQPADYDYETETAGRSKEIKAVSAESEEIPLTVDTNDIKLPFGIEISSFSNATPSPSTKKVSEQEALIYLKNSKKGRQLEATADTV